MSTLLIESGELTWSVAGVPCSEPLKLQAVYAVPRNPAFGYRAHKFVERFPSCAACGGQTMLQVHHKLPFHLYPELEMEESNWIVLCMERDRICHLRIGHGLDFHAYNPMVEADARRSLKGITNRIYIKDGHLKAGFAPLLRATMLDGVNVQIATPGPVQGGDGTVVRVPRQGADCYVVFDGQHGAFWHEVLPVQGRIVQEFPHGET